MIASILMLIFVIGMFLTAGYSGYLQVLVHITTVELNTLNYFVFLACIGCFIGLIGSFIYWIFDD